jgi:hypothetical protein
MRSLGSFLAPLVLAVWALLAAAGCNSRAITIGWLLVLLVAFGFHIRSEMERHVL